MQKYHFIKSVFWLLFALAIFFGPARAVAAPILCDQTLDVAAGGNTYNIPVCSNTTLLTPGSGYEKAVIVIHGLNRTAVSYHTAVMDALALDPSSTTANTLVNSAAVFDRRRY